MMRSLSLVVAGAVCVSSAWAQDVRQLEVHVTSVSGRDVYLDMGRSSGLAQGQIVRLFPPGAAELEVTVRAVSSTSARAELLPGEVPPAVGTRGEVSVPKAKPTGSTSTPTKPEKPPVPDHPPWSRTADARGAEEPLLVPTFGQKPDERPMTLDGRVFASSFWSRDSGGDRADQYLLSRLGVHAEATNALGYGERTLFAGEIADRRSMLQAQPDREELNSRIDLLSTAFGTEHWAPLGVEVGRFLSSGLPEIGLVDGAEGVWRYGTGTRIGGGVGAYPRPFPGRASGEDLGVHGFFDYASDERRSFATTLGVQKTWHRGAPDRDLLLLRAELRPRDDVWLYANAKVDYYTASDTRKPSGFEITELFTQARWDGPKIGAGLALSHFAYPDLKRVEYQNLPDDLVRNGKIDRASISSWIRPMQDLRLNGRIDIWQDQDNSGTSFELGSDWSNFLQSGTYLSAQVFRSDGGFQSGPGFRLLARRQVGEVSLNAGYRWYGYEINGLLTGTESYTRQAFEAGASWYVGDVDLDLQLEHSFGTQENAYAISIYAQWRF